MKAAEILKNVIVGALAGIFMILPGASGATITVVFGIYERLIHDVSKLKNIVSDIRFLLTIAIGGVLGVLFCSKGLSFLLTDYEIPLMFFFAALILVQIPDIHRQADDGQKATSMNILALIAGFAVMMVIMLLGIYQEEQLESPGFILLFLAGMLYIICAISPGISGSTMLLALGLFTPVITAVGDLQIMSLIPLALGAVVGLILFAKIVDRCVTDHRKSTFFAILGLTLGSIVTVIVQASMGFDQNEHLIGSIIGLAAGFILGYGMHLLSNYYMKTMESEE